jgi:hypothetical protein
LDVERQDIRVYQNARDSKVSWMLGKATGTYTR